MASPTGLVAPPGPTWPRRILRFAGALVAPALLALLTVRFAFPSRLNGAAGGVTGFLAWLVDRYPLFVSIGLFLAFSETGRYWTNRLRAPAERAAPARAALSARSLRRLGIGLAGVAVVVFISRSSLVATYKISGPSMLPTLEIGDRVLVNRLAYGVALPLSRARLHQRLPHRGDLVVFEANGMAGAHGAESFVKRVFGLPGDVISVQQGGLAINGWTVPACDAGPYAEMFGPMTARGRLMVEFLDDRTYLTVRKPIEPAMPSYTVKPGEVYVIGDDRGMSTDSRAWNEGHGAGVPLDILQGRVTRVLFGARPDGGLDYARLLKPPLDLRVRMTGIDLAKTDQRIQSCLSRRPAETSPPRPAASQAMSF